MNEELIAAYKADPNQNAGGWFARVFSGMTDRIENPISAADWIANDPRVEAGLIAFVNQALG